jgi:hypothetical protein
VSASKTGPSSRVVDWVVVEVGVEDPAVVEVDVEVDGALLRVRLHELELRLGWEDFFSPWIDRL